jgi:hypothetical protein
MSYGTGPFGSFGFGLPLAESTASRGTAVSSRAIDEHGRIVQTGDETGSFRGMSDTRQRVYILCCLVEEPIKQGPDFEATMRTRIRTALLPLTQKPSPVIKLLGVDVEQTSNGSKKMVRFQDLLTGQADQVDL